MAGADHSRRHGCWNLHGLLGGSRCPGRRHGGHLHGGHRFSGRRRLDPSGGSGHSRFERGNSKSPGNLGRKGCHRHQRHGGYHGIQRAGERGHRGRRGCGYLRRGAAPGASGNCGRPGCDAGAGGIQRPGGALDRPGVEETRPETGFYRGGRFRCRRS